MKFPADLKYTKDHEWIRVENGKTAYVGITDFAQSELGDIVYVDIDTIGETLKQHDVFGTVEAVKTTSDLFMPISGTVLEINDAVSEDGGDDPTLINSDPYGDGWIIKVELSNPDELNGLLDAKSYQDLVS